MGAASRSPDPANTSSCPLVAQLLGDDPGRFEDAADEEGEEDEDQFEEFEQQQQPNGALR